jgi:membrane associated rhomboid family serine protease
MSAPFASPPSRQPIFNLPSVVIVLLAIMVGVHFLRTMVLWPEAKVAFVLNTAFFPVRISDPAFAAAFDPALNGAVVWMFVTYAFLHADLMHLIVNGVWMAAFATPLAWRFGPVRFLLFSVLGAIGGAMAHLWANFGDQAPMVGASAMVSAHMAATCRFAFEPGAPLSGYAGDPRVANRQPAPPLMAMLGNQRAMIFLAVWFGINLIFGLGVGNIGSGSIAWQAHIGGFVVGLLAFAVFDPIPRHPAPRPPGAAGLGL